MSIHVSFKQIKHSTAVTEHINELMKELVKVTDDRFPFHVNLIKDSEETHTVVINCNYKDKALVSKATHANLYRAISKSVDSMKTQVIKKVNKTRDKARNEDKEPEEIPEI
ncbi:HPF/RaiA family ribosome-associated protein [Deltaproteobacteria bacterium TL4]